MVRKNPRFLVFETNLNSRLNLSSNSKTLYEKLFLQKIELSLKEDLGKEKIQFQPP